ncbi:MAG: hypothetical protein AB7P01_03845 [Bacteroidia bacterium]
MNYRLLITGFSVFLLACASGQAQVPTFYKDVYPILSENCISCHNQKNGVAPFSLETYDEVVKNAKLVQYVIDKGIMPPWKADTAYRHFRNERVLTKNEINTIKEWANAGYVKGNYTKQPLLNYSSSLNDPDMVIKLPVPYPIPATNSDLFITYIKQIDLGEDKMLRAIEIVPGNKKMVHHCRVDFDRSSRYIAKADSLGFVNSNELNTVADNLPEFLFVGDYVPGISPYIYPENAGYFLPSKLYILINLHYSPTTKDEYDQTEVRLYFHKDTAGLSRVVYSSCKLNVKTALNRPDISLPPNEEKCFLIQSQPYKNDLSLICIQPHMHLFGKSMKVYALSPDKSDTIPLCKIDDWDFRWQENYYFEKPLKIPKGYIMIGEACYDNTVNNPSNPFYPPRMITFLGDMKTTNEMMEFYIQSINYKEGDEDRIWYK